MTAVPFGGLWCHALELTRALSELNVQVGLATLGGFLSRERRRDVKSISHTEVFESAFKCEWMDNPWDDVKRAGEWLLDLEQKIRPDIIHLNGCLLSILPWQAPKIVSGHSCIIPANKTPDSQAWARYCQYARAGLQAADMVVASTRSMLTELADFAGPINLRVIFNGRDPDLFNAGRKEPFILSSGHLHDPARNLSALAAIAEKLPWPIRVVGEQSPSERRGKSGLSLMGSIPASELSRCFSKASIFALPARHEPFGLSALEAGLAGCALVLGDIPSLRETWSGAACFVNPEDPEQLRHCLKRLIDYPELLRDWAAMAQCRAIQFTPKEMGSRHLAAYRELMSARQTGLVPEATRSS